MMRDVATETRAHFDLDQLERMLTTAHRICADGVDRNDPRQPDLKNWFYSWCFVLERLIGEIAAQKKKVRR